MDQAHLHFTFTYDAISKYAILACPRTLGPLCLTLLGMEGIGLSLYTFDSHIKHNFYLNGFLACYHDSMAALPRFAPPGRDWIKFIYI